MLHFQIFYFQMGMFELDLVIGFKSKTFGEKMKGAPEECANVPVEYSFIVKRPNQPEIFSRYFHRKFEIGNVFFTKVENIEGDIQRFLADGFLMMNEEDFKWYPTIKYFKQNEDRNWGRVLKTLRNNLEKEN